MTSSNAMSFVQDMLVKTMYNKELAKTLFEKLFSELPEQVTAIDKAMENQDFPMAIEVTHKLHGSASFCGLTDIKNPAEMLEICLRKHDLAPVENHFKTLRKQVDLFTAAEDEIMRILASK